MFGTMIESTMGQGPHYVDLASVPGVPILRFQRVDEPKTTKNRLHVDLSVGDLDAACARVEKLGGRRISGNALIENGYIWIVMEDPGGNEFCIGKDSA